jgi:hypothetical protein
MDHRAGTQVICAVCAAEIRSTENKITVQGIAYHPHCWDRKARIKAKK